jgi:hypothetical protein
MHSANQSHPFFLRLHELWTVENTWDWTDKTLTSTHELSVWSSSSFGRWHPRSSVLFVLTRHSFISDPQWMVDTCDQSFYARASRTASWGALAKLDSHFLLSLRCFNSFHYVMILLLFWGHEPCIGFFLWRFNTPDALICYPGSIEKLKLLGATYLLTYFLEFRARTWYRRQIIVGLDRMDWTWSGVTSGALVHSILSCGCGHQSTWECAPGFHWACSWQWGHLWESTALGEILDFWRPVFSHPWMLLEVLIHQRGPSNR